MARLNQIYRIINRQTLSKTERSSRRYSEGPGTPQSAACAFPVFTCFLLNVAGSQAKTRHEFESTGDKADGADPFTSQNYFVPTSDFPSPVGPSPASFLVISYFAMRVLILGPGGRELAVDSGVRLVPMDTCR